MKLAVVVALLGASASWVEAGQTRRAASPPATQTAPAADRVAEAYDQFLRAHLLQEEDVEGAITAYRRAMALDPQSAAIAADLADLLMKESRGAEAIQAAEQALRLNPDNRDAHRVLGTIYATLASASPSGQRMSRAAQQENLERAVQHLEKSIEPPMAQADANQRAMLARLYIATDAFDKAIPVLADLVKQEPNWRDGPELLTEAYSSAGRMDEALKWFEEAAPDNPQLFGTLGELYGRNRRWSAAATAYEQGLRVSPRSVEYRRGLAEALLNSGSRADALRGRDVAREAVSLRGTDEQSLYLLSEAERMTGDARAGEDAARRLIVQNPRNPQGYAALAEALEDQRRFQPIIDSLAPAIATLRSANNNRFALGRLLPHLGFAYQQVGQFDKAVATFEEARKLSPEDPGLLNALVRAQLAAKNYTAAAELARTARLQNPADLRLARLESEALRSAGQVDKGLAVLEEIVRQPGSEAAAHLLLAQAYADVNRMPQATKVLRDAQAQFPDNTTITFELGALLDRQKKFSESEALFRQLIAREPQNAPALNYLGYMLAERGDRLDESVDYIKRALAIEPDNGSYLDSIGWAYFKDGKLDLALNHLERAATQLEDNSVVQDHYAEVLFKLGRYDAAIGAWNKALDGDGDAIDRGDIDRKIRSARQKLPKK